MAVTYLCDAVFVKQTLRPDCALCIFGEKMIPGRNTLVDYRQSTKKALIFMKDGTDMFLPPVSLTSVAIVLVAKFAAGVDR
jgi:hypothetical protein